MSLTQKAVIVNPQDNVATAIADLKTGENLELQSGDQVRSIKLMAPIPSGHKFSLTTIKAGAAVIKYGETIGTATNEIQPGAHVHIHNVVSTRGRGDLTGERD